MQIKNLKTVCYVSWSEANLKTNQQSKGVIQLEVLGIGSQPLENVVVLNHLMALIFPFGCLKKTNLKGCDCEN